MAVAILGLSTSCGKDDPEEAAAPKSLVGTQWVYEETETDVDEEEGYTYTTSVMASLNFNTESAGVFAVSLVYAVDGETMFDESEETNITYTYDGKGNGTFTDVSDDPETITFTISGNKLTAVPADGDTSDVVIFTRK